MKELTLDGNLTLGGSLITLGDQVTDTIDFNVSFAQSLYGDTTDTYDLGTNSLRWRRANLGGLDLDSYTIEDNTIQVNNTNENVDLRASGTGTVGFEEIRANNNTLSTYANDLEFANDVTITSTDNIKLPVGTNLQRKDQVGDLRYNSDLGIFEGYSGGNVSFDGLYDTDRDTFMDLSNNRFRFVTGNAYNTLLNGDILETTRLDSQNSLSIDSNIVTSATPNADIQFLSNGLGSIGQEDLVFKNSTITNTLNTPFTFGLADVFSYLKFDQPWDLLSYGDDTTDPELLNKGKHVQYTTRIS